MTRLLSVAALAAFAALGLAAPADASACRYGHAANGRCVGRTPHAKPPLHAHARGPRVRGSSWSPQQPPVSVLPQPVPDTAPRRVYLGHGPVAPNVPNNLPPVNTPQPPL